MFAFNWMKTKHSDLDKGSRRSYTIIKYITAISLFDIIIMCEILKPDGYQYPWIAAFIRPFYFVLFTKWLREYWKRYILVMIDCFPMIQFLVTFILYWSWMG